MSTFSGGGKKSDSYNGKLVFEQSNNRIIGRDENFVPRMLILADGLQFVMKISEEGVDVLTATEDQLIFNSDNNLFKIGIAGSGQAPAITKVLAATNTYVGVDQNSIPHGLSYVPEPIGFVIVGSNKYALPYTRAYPLVSGGGIGVDTYTISTDATNVYLGRNTVEYGAGATAGSSGATDIEYFLLTPTA